MTKLRSTHPRRAAALHPSVPGPLSVPVLCLLFLVGACESANPVADESDPEPLVLTLQGPERVESVVQGRALRCDYTLEAVVTGGEPGDEVYLLDLTLEWTEIDGEPILDTNVPSARVASDWFQGNRIASGETRSTPRHVFLVPERPFQHVHTLRYRLGSMGEIEEATYTLVCD